MKLDWIRPVHGPYGSCGSHDAALRSVDAGFDGTPNCSYNVMVSSLRFDWDPAKARSNLRKQGVSFEEAASVFLDESAVEFYDDDASEWADRFLLLGMSMRARMLLVCHCVRDDDVIRIISARKATRSEARYYRKG